MLSEHESKCISCKWAVEIINFETVNWYAPPSATLYWCQLLHGLVTLDQSNSPLNTVLIYKEILYIKRV